jgi:hypothetical protein
MRKIRLNVVVLLAFALFSTVVVVAQSLTSDPVSPPAPLPARPQFFGGTVVELDSSHIKVTRALVGRPTESRSFALNTSTKMNKAVIKMHTRVTVRYKHLPEGDLALEIQLRPVITRAPKA